MASEDTLLWKNGSPTSAFAPGPVPLNNCLEHFKYLVFICKVDTGTSSAQQCFKCKNIIGTSGYMNFCTEGNNEYERTYSITSDTSITFLAGRVNGESNNAAGIPLEIWGTNNL